MGKVDSKGRIVLPQEIRERLGITPGTEVEVREVDGKVVVEPEDDPERILDRMETLLADADERTPADYDDLDPHAKTQVDAIRRQASDDE